MPLFVSEINFAAVTLTENVGVIFAPKQNKKDNACEIRENHLYKHIRFPTGKTSHPYALRAVFRSLRFSIERGANIVFLPINPMILVI